MADHAVEHDYHLLPPSPWPFLAGLACTVWGVGMVAFFAGLYPRNAADPNGLMEFLFSRGMDMFGAEKVSNGGWIFLALGCIFATIVMIGWWRDVAKEGNTGDHTPVVQIGLRYGMIMFIMQEVMFFVGWFWMFFEFVLFRKERANWNPDVLEGASAYADSYGLNAAGNQFSTIGAWNLPLLNTLVLLLSGTTVTWAHHALIKNDRKSASTGLVLTFLLGFIFIFLQGLEYKEAFHERLANGFWLDSNIYGSTFFLATGFHGLHVLIGAIFLFSIWLRLIKGSMTPKQHFGFEAAAWYWHFVDVVWLFLFTFVYVVFAMG
ncbi:MAG: cytochrome c oxidase subunit 3 [Robiginitomaculum sp.]|nr:MAG: cytochrome c oxidase subunit 3 [Robiginitomaculum sp.]